MFPFALLIHDGFSVRPDAFAPILSPKGSEGLLVSQIFGSLVLVFLCRIIYLRMCGGRSESLTSQSWHSASPDVFLAS